MSSLAPEAASGRLEASRGAPLLIWAAAAATTWLLPLRLPSNPPNIKAFPSSRRGDQTERKEFRTERCDSERLPLKLRRTRAGFDTPQRREDNESLRAEHAARCLFLCHLPAEARLKLFCRLDLKQKCNPLNRLTVCSTEVFLEKLQTSW